jgi:putative ABC transport system substrate-binding protein
MIILFLCLILLSSLPLANAQPPERVPRIGVLVNGNPTSHKFIIDEFQQGLHDLGYAEGRNVFIDYRYAEGKLERLSELVRELVDRKVDLIFTQATPGTVAAKNVTSSIPIVFTGVGDPVASGLVTSFGKPGGNVTGLSILSPELSGKRLELLKEVVPGLTRIAFLWSPSASTTAALKAIGKATDTLQLQLHSLEVRSPDEFTTVSETIMRKRLEAILTNPSPVLNTIRKRVGGVRGQEPIARDVCKLAVRR